MKSPAALRRWHPAYVALVVAPGTVSIASQVLGLRPIAFTILSRCASPDRARVESAR